jgi:Domain of unknown function (DUF4272)
MSDAPLSAVEQDDVLGEHDEIDVELRAPNEVRARILILATVLRRLALENAAVNDSDELSAEAFDQREWLREQGLARELTAGEATLLESPLGAVAPEAIIDVSWQGEALMALAWGIGVGSMPPIDTVADPRPVIDIVPRPWDGTQEWLDDPTIVSEAEAAYEREVAEIWHWRMTTEVLRRAGSAADSEDYDEAIRDVAAEAVQSGLVAALRQGDFLVRGEGIKNLSANELDELVAVTGQRLRALNWLCGFGAAWDDVPLDL